MYYTRFNGKRKFAQDTGKKKIEYEQSMALVLNGMAQDPREKNEE
jgi:hypothetical protein